MMHLPDKLARYLRVTPGSDAHRLAGPLWAEALALAAPATWSERMDTAGFLEAFAPHAAASDDLARTLQGCPEVRLMAATIGDALETRARELFAQAQPFAGFMLDRMGSYLVEAPMRELHRGVRACLRQAGGDATRRYSPGYGDFSLQAQACFVRLAGQALPQLRLTSAFMLLPEKSVTAVCGLLPR